MRVSTPSQQLTRNVTVSRTPTPTPTPSLRLRSWFGSYICLVARAAGRQCTFVHCKELKNSLTARQVQSQVISEFWGVEFNT
jgi:hypothetical protein